MMEQTENDRRLRDYKIAEATAAINGVGKSLDQERNRIDGLAEWRAVHKAEHWGLQKSFQTYKEGVDEQMNNFTKQVCEVKTLLIKTILTVIGVGLFMAGVNVVLHFI